MTAPRSKKMERRPHEPSANGERLLPQSPDAEQAVLSSILLNPGDCLRRCRQKGVSAAQFHIPAHATIYAVIEEMFWEAGFGQDDKPLNFISVTNELRNRGDLERAGGAAFVTELFTFIPRRRPTSTTTSRFCKRRRRCGRRVYSLKNSREVSH